MDVHIQRSAGKIFDLAICKKIATDFANVVLVLHTGNQSLLA
jgi:hypothetical protein